MRKNSFIGTLGLIALIFGIITFFLIAEDEFYFSRIHLILGAVLITWFFFRGGLKLVSQAAIRRAAGFGAGVTIYSALFIGVLGLLNYIVLRHDPLYFDSTEQKVFTIAPQTKKVVSNLKQKVIIRGFYVGGIADPDIEELVNRIKRSSQNLEWRVVDPVKFPNLAEKYGISERDTLHFSIDEEGSKREVKIARNIDEQEIVNAILKLTRGGDKKVYWISGHGEANLDDKDQAGYLFLKEAIQGENISVEKLELAKVGKIPQDASAILLMAPRKELIETEEKEISRYLENGGNAVLLSEPNTTRAVAELAKPFGLNVGEDIVLDEVVKLLEGPTLVVQPMVTDYGDHAITKDFSEGVIFSTVNSVSINKEASSESQVVEFAFTGKKSWAETNVTAVFGEPPTATLEPNDRKGPVPVAAAVDGKGRIVVVGDADFVANINIRHLFNRDFILNSLNWVLGDDEKVSIRAATMRGSAQGLSESQFQRMFLFTAILLPELIIIWGLAVWFKRQ